MKFQHTRHEVASAAFETVTLTTRTTVSVVGRNKQRKVKHRKTVQSVTVGNTPTKSTDTVGAILRQQRAEKDTVSVSVKGKVLGPKAPTQTLTVTPKGSMACSAVFRQPPTPAPTLTEYVLEYWDTERSTWLTHKRQFHKREHAELFIRCSKNQRLRLVLRKHLGADSVRTLRTLPGGV